MPERASIPTPIDDGASPLPSGGFDTAGRRRWGAR